MLTAIILIAGLTMCSMSIATLAACVARRRSLRKVTRVERQKTAAQIAGISKKLSIDAQQLALERRGWKGWRKLVIEKVYDESDDCRSFELVDPEGLPLPPFLPGQYLTIKIELTAMEAIQRCYSLSDSPSWKHLRITVKRVPGGRGSNWLHDNAKAGTILAVRAPAGHFIANARVSQPLILIGAGIGITPLLSILKSVRTTQPQRRIDLYYQVRDLLNAVLLREIAEAVSNHPAFRLFLYVSRPPEEIQAWVAGTGRLKVKHVLDSSQPMATSEQPQFMICGPDEMMDSFRAGLINAGMDPTNIITEAFLASKPKALTSTPVAGLPEEERPFAREVTFARSNTIGLCTERDTTLLDVAEAAGVRLNSSCRSGECGSCAIRKLSGRTSYLHPPSFSELGEDEVLACLAQPLEPVVLDL